MPELKHAIELTKAHMPELKQFFIRKMRLLK
jgi:hypothetical protein